VVAGVALGGMAVAGVAVAGVAVAGVAVAVVAVVELAAVTAEARRKGREGKGKRRSLYFVPTRIKPTYGCLRLFHKLRSNLIFLDSGGVDAFLLHGHQMTTVRTSCAVRMVSGEPPASLLLLTVGCRCVTLHQVDWR
jgi:hypothetical protein